jgi:hypothetical protein
MTIADKTVWYKCEWCPCLFLTQHDLDLHLHSFRTTGVKPNEYDHKIRWKNELYKRDHEFIGQEGF